MILSFKGVELERGFLAEQSAAELLLSSNKAAYSFRTAPSLVQWSLQSGLGMFRF